MWLQHVLGQIQQECQRVLQHQHHWPAFSVKHGRVLRRPQPGWVVVQQILCISHRVDVDAPQRVVAGTRSFVILFHLG